ncbi:MAG: hypothetical protein AB1758_06415 [Candidatus Eremiobacterota bacterium]
MRTLRPVALLLCALLLACSQGGSSLTDSTAPGATLTMVHFGAPW